MAAWQYLVAPPVSMYGIDPPTLVIVVSFLAVMLSIILLAMRSGFSGTVAGIGHWAFAIPLFVASSVLFSQQHTHPIVHVMIANGLILAGMLYMNAGMMRFYQRRVPRLSTVMLLAAGIMAVLAWNTFVQSDFVARLIMMSLLGSVLFGNLCSLPLRHGRRSVGSIITSVAFGLTTTSCLLRMVSAAVDVDRPAALLDLAGFQVIYLTSFNFSLVIGSVGFILLVNERLREVLEYSASHDTLTGALNRGAFFKTAETEFHRSRQTGNVLSVALIDLDHFKDINDRYGHPVGDQVLQDFCRSVRRQLRPIDLLGRYGGEEFVVLFPGAAGPEAAGMVQRLRKAICPAETLPSYTVSIGVATLSSEVSTIDELLGAADEALYIAKRNGRNRVEEWGKPAVSQAPFAALTFETGGLPTHVNRSKPMQDVA